MDKAFSPFRLFLGSSRFGTNWNFNWYANGFSSRHLWIEFLDFFYKSAGAAHPFSACMAAHRSVGCCDGDTLSFWLCASLLPCQLNEVISTTDPKHAFGTNFFNT